MTELEKLQEVKQDINNTIMMMEKRLLAKLEQDKKEILKELTFIKTKVKRIDKLNRQRRLNVDTNNEKGT